MMFQYMQLEGKVMLSFAHRTLHDVSFQLREEKVWTDVT